MNEKLYLGCGPLPLHKQHLQIIDDTWTLIDLYVKDPSIINMDARHLDYPDKSISKIYTSHLLEHFGIKEIVPILKEWFRVLKFVGELVINVPDMEWASNELIRLENGEDPQSSVFDTPDKIMEIFYGNQDHEGEYHKCGFTEKSLRRYLIEAGFYVDKIDKIYEAHDMGCLIARAGQMG